MSWSALLLPEEFIALFVCSSYEQRTKPLLNAVELTLVPSKLLVTFTSALEFHSPKLLSMMKVTQLSVLFSTLALSAVSAYAADA